MKLIEKFQIFKKEMKDFSNDVNISKIFIMDNKNVLDKLPKLHEKSRKQVNNFIEYIHKMKFEKSEFIKRVYFINNMRIRLYEINQKYSEKELLNKDEKNTLQNFSDLSYENFKNEMNDWKWCFPSNFDNFKNKYELKIKTLKESFYRNDASNLKDKTYVIRDNYIRDQYNLLFPEMTEMIENDILNFINNCYDRLINKLPASLKQKLKNLILENIEYDNSKVGNLIIYRVISGIFLAAVVGFATAAALIGSWGWIIGAVVGVVSLRSYTGMWKRDDCFDDTLKSFYDLTIKNIDNIIDSALKKYEYLVKKFKEILLNLKETLDEINKLYEILSSYNVKRNINSDETFEMVFKKALIEFEEKDEIKNIFSIIFNK